MSPYIKHTKTLKQAKPRGLHKLYEVRLSQDADKFISKLNSQIQERIIERLKKLSLDPIPSDSKFIERTNFGEKIFRYRIGDFRALYIIQEETERVIITKIDKRPRVYD